MTIYSERTSRSLLTNAIDPEGDPISVRRINGQIITTWPHVISLPVGEARIAETGQVTYDDTGVSTDHPDVGQTSMNGAFTFSL